MDFYLIPLLVQIVNLALVIFWITGLILIVIEFFREFRGREYDTDSQETEKFRAWKGKRYRRVRRGIIIMVSGITTQVVFTSAIHFVRQYVMNKMMG